MRTVAIVKYGFLLVACGLNAACGSEKGRVQTSGSADGDGGTNPPPTPDAATDGTSSQLEGGKPTPRPAWNPALPLGEMGWRESRSPFCSEHLAELSPRVWSNTDSVYVLLTFGCNVFSSTYSCDDPDAIGQVLYRNDGTGWRRIHEVVSSMADPEAPKLASQIVGLSTGAVALLGGECPVLVVDPTGEAQCILENVGDVVSGAAAGERLYVLANHDDAGTSRSLMEFSGGTWQTLLTLPPPDIGYHVAAAGDTIALVGLTLRIGNVVDRSFEPRPGTPAGTYSNAWVLNSGDVVAGNGVGQIVRFDGTTWTVADTGTLDRINGVWGADDGTVFFFTQNHFGRVRGEQVDLVTTSDTSEANHYFVDVWGNSSSEVFVAVNDRSFGHFECGVTFLLWFDGSLFHVF